MPKEEYRSLASMNEMAKFKIVLLSVLLSGCSMKNYATYTQCQRDPRVDGALITGVTGVPFAIAASTPIGLSVGVLFGGSYYIVHDAACK